MSDKISYQKQAEAGAADGSEDGAIALDLGNGGTERRLLRVAN
jgi:hypothetical protein